MSWDVVMFGALTVPERNLEEWLTTNVTADEFPWLDELGGSDVTASTPEALLVLLTDTALAPHEFMRVSREGSQLRLDGYLSEDAYRLTCQAMCMLFASASAFGGSGELTFFGYQGIRFAERLGVSSQGVSIAQLSLDELPIIERSSEFKDLNARIHERYDALVGRPPVPSDSRRVRWAVHPFTGRKVRVAASG